MIKKYRRRHAALAFLRCKICLTNTNISENPWKSIAVKALSYVDFKSVYFRQEFTGSYFMNLKYPSWLYYVLQSWVFFQYKCKWCLISTDKAKLLCDIGVKGSATTEVSPAVVWAVSPSVNTAKISTFDDSSNYNSPFPSALVPKIFSIENPNAILAWQIVALWGKKETWL